MGINMTSFMGLVIREACKTRQGPPPILFGQCPKEINFSFVRCSLIAIKDTQISGSTFLAFLHSLMTSFTTLCLSLSSFSSTSISMTTIAPTTYIYCRQHDHIHHLQHSVQPLCPHLASPFQLALPSKWPSNQDTHCLSHPPPVYLTLLLHHLTVQHLLDIGNETIFGDMHHNAMSYLVMMQI